MSEVFEQNLFAGIECLVVIENIKKTFVVFAVSQNISVVLNIFIGRIYNNFLS